MIQVERERVERPVILEDSSTANGVGVFLVLAIIMSLIIAFSIGSLQNNSTTVVQPTPAPAPQATPFVPLQGPPGPPGPQGPAGTSTTTTVVPLAPANPTLNPAVPDLPQPQPESVPTPSAGTSE